MAVKRGLELRQKRPNPKNRKVRWTSAFFNRTTSESAKEVLEESHHSEDGDNLGSQPDDVMPDSQNGGLCTTK